MKQLIKFFALHSLHKLRISSKNAWLFRRSKESQQSVRTG
jgi:hypothetical protein